MAPKKRKNIYVHSIECKPLKVRNAPREVFRKQLEAIPYRGYEVETISDGRKILIAKPGGKRVFGQPKKEDFLVFIYDPDEESLWQITHKQILDDLKLKAEENASLTIKIIKNLERVHAGEDPDDLAPTAKKSVANPWTFY